MSENAEAPILVTLSGNVMLIRLLHPENAEEPMLVTPSGIVMLVRLPHPENAPSPMLVTLSGIVMLVRLLQYENALSPMLSPLVITTVFKLSLGISLIANAGIVTLSNEEQPMNAKGPMLVTLSGIVMLVRLLHS